jgi:hypothetical protein
MAFLALGEWREAAKDPTGAHEIRFFLCTFEEWGGKQLGGRWTAVERLGRARNGQNGLLTALLGPYSSNCPRFL